jgi:hypothetical protein
MDSNARIGIFHAKMRNKHGLKLPCTGTKPTDARRRLIESVDNYTGMLPDGETVLCVIIPEHGSGKARLAGSFAIEEGIAALEGLDSVIPGRKKLEDLLAGLKRTKAAMDEQNSEGELVLKLQVQLQGYHHLSGGSLGSTCMSRDCTGDLDK